MNELSKSAPEELVMKQAFETALRQAVAGMSEEIKNKPLTRAHVEAIAFDAGTPEVVAAQFEGILYMLAKVRAEREAAGNPVKEEDFIFILREDGLKVEQAPTFNQTPETMSKAQQAENFIYVRARHEFPKIYAEYQAKVTDAFTMKGGEIIGELRARPGFEDMTPEELMSIASAALKRVQSEFSVLTIPQPGAN